MSQDTLPTNDPATGSVTTQTEDGTQDVVATTNVTAPTDSPDEGAPIDDVEERKMPSAQGTQAENIKVVK